MVSKLKDIAEVSSGGTFRSRIKASPSGNVRVIQMRDLGKDNAVHLAQAMRVECAKPKPRQLARVGDLVFRSRGYTNTAALLSEEAGDTIVAAPLFRVRPNRRKVMPEFLLWWINQASSQAYLNSRSEGTLGMMVSKRVLEELEVNVPPLEQQRRVVEFFALATKELRLLEELINRKALVAQEILMQMASEPRLTASKTAPGFDAAASSLGATTPHPKWRVSR